MMDIIELSNNSINDVISKLKARGNTSVVRKSVEEIVNEIIGIICMEY